MAGRTADGLLCPGDPAPVGLFNAEGTSPFLLIGDHAGSALPRALGNLGLEPGEMGRHIAIDIGVYGLGHALAKMLDAPFVHQTYSRLVIDCNRDPDRVDAIPEVSDGTRIHGNEGLPVDARMARIGAIHRAYHAQIAAIIDARKATGLETVIVSLHSFTPTMDGTPRPWHVGILHGAGRADFAYALLQELRREDGLNVGDNVPYAMDDTDYTVPLHAFTRSLRYTEIEIRQDLLANGDAQQLWAARFNRTLVDALALVTP
ncbi:N-formylglutamate amidohydrolase [Novosphingobium barchaimii LL02]|uniref:N-formylglutamate amidohydrolase n=1 Tax=Novosphingobium barchaimii LL02 TaxID=1114963 RepID=A0A0J7XXX9_9SPHN|nr:N-formylglutamate amidohydrolase [Novosphingobium barchaimii]KMS56128.1 N-formylglutamate amidohydrolase [Novosphingobium barchaimii LL02]